MPVWALWFLWSHFSEKLSRLQIYELHQMKPDSGLIFLFILFHFVPLTIRPIQSYNQQVFFRIYCIGESVPFTDIMWHNYWHKLCWWSCMSRFFRLILLLGWLSFSSSWPRFWQGKQSYCKSLSNKYNQGGNRKSRNDRQGWGWLNAYCGGHYFAKMKLADFLLARRLEMAIVYFTLPN